MAHNINEIKSQLIGGGARPSLFDVIITPPAALGTLAVPDSLKFNTTAKGASLPGSTIGTIEVPYFGRKVKVAGDRTFAEWTVTVMNDEDFIVREGIMSWMHAINAHEGNVRHLGATSAPLTYKGEAIVRQYSKEGDIIHQYQIVGLWPSDSSDIEVNWETTDTIEEFTVTFQYDEWKKIQGTQALIDN